MCVGACLRPWPRWRRCAPQGGECAWECAWECACGPGRDGAGGGDPGRGSCLRPWLAGASLAGAARGPQAASMRGGPGSCQSHHATASVPPWFDSLSECNARAVILARCGVFCLCRHTGQAAPGATSPLWDRAQLVLRGSARDGTAACQQHGSRIALTKVAGATLAKRAQLLVAAQAALDADIARDVRLGPGKAAAPSGRCDGLACTMAWGRPRGRSWQRATAGHGLRATAPETGERPFLGPKPHFTAKRVHCVQLAWHEN